MKILKVFTLSALMFCCVACNSGKSQLEKIEVVFQEDSLKFSEPQKIFISELIHISEKEVRNVLPNLPDSIKVIVERVNWDLDRVGGVTGRTERNSPPTIAIQLSNSFRRGIVDSLELGIRSTVFHEFHHLARGWAIYDNKFGYGIPNAMVNEGLAVVFAEIYTGYISDANAFTDEADSWVKEILDLPLDASYNKWVMGKHPDGRTSIGYRAGNYLIRKAMKTSGKSVVELSALKPIEIISLAGY
ncbi:DUF2268 domain-containing putative Zn-dependent protease [Seonamhaeicola marinus]|uniref:DUF2268 domain-containing protein n=1 Tax=Seonamhaeicola marinus TaxID=1912246 RepID=A0A5D0HU42_9FLAO|nr:DUF2268 domain-containing putative Zn-dependent protease [Seonamhaeicola marinus]TYA74826.1 hypothetical protein FUA24_16090 [Seonamhaeicola marinus]